MKLNKNTHFFIITTFAIVFVVVYLYYTIVDVRRLSNDVSRLSRDLVALSETVNKKQNQEVQMHPLLVPVPVTPEAAQEDEEPIDITKILSDITQEETEEAAPEETAQPTDDFKSMKYEDLKDLCKKNNLSTKGTKAELITRLLENNQESA